MKRTQTLIVPLASILVACLLGTAIQVSEGGSRFAQLLLQNTGFEEAVPDHDGTFDPAVWEITEGKTIVEYREGFRFGTGKVAPGGEQPALVQVVGSENGVTPHEGGKMLKIDARLYIKSHVRQSYSSAIETGKLVQEVAVYPHSDQYLQQIEIRGNRDKGFGGGGRWNPEGVRGNQLFALKYSHEKMMLVVTTGKEWKDGRHIIWKEYPPLPLRKWSVVRIVLEKVAPTKDEKGRTISQWRLILSVNGKLLYESGRDGAPPVQYFESADFVVIGDDYVLPEDKPAEKNNMGPTTGDSFGVVYYDAARATQETKPQDGTKVTSQQQAPFVIILPTYRNCDALIDAWNGGLGKASDVVVCMPSPEGLKNPAEIERTLARVQQGAHAWVTPSFALVQKGEAKIPKTVKWFFYDHEPWQHTPQEEKENVVAVSRAIREFCDKRGLKAGITPIYAKFQDNFNLEHIKQVARYYDAYILQCQDFQKDPVQRERVVKLLRDTTEAIHSVNPTCLVGCQLGAAERYGGVKAAMALYEATKKFIQIYTAWWEPEEAQMIELLKAIRTAPEKAPAAASSLQPIETLWWIAAIALTEANEKATAEAIRQWRGIFDAFSVGVLPPTFVDPQESLARINRLSQSIGGRLIVGVFPVGTDGWETSFNERFAQQWAAQGVRFDASRAMTQKEWLDRLKALDAETWAWVLEQPARRPTIEQATASAVEFVRFAKSHNKRAVLWLSAMMLRDAAGVEMARRLIEATKQQADYFAWMDLPIVSQEPGRSLGQLLDVILSLTPQEKVTKNMFS